MAVDNDAVEDIFKEVRDEYQAELKSWLVVLLEEMAKIAPSQPGADLGTYIERIREITHKIAGSSGSFGFKEVSQTALPVEKLCIEISKGGVGLSPENMVALTGLITTLQRAIENPQIS